MRVCIVPEFPAGLMTGGLQVQAEETWRALNLLGDGISAELFNWSERKPLPDLYHFISFQPFFHRIAGLIRQAGRPYVITLLFGSSQERGQIRRAALRQYFKSQVLRRRERYEAIAGASAMVTITEADAYAAQTIYQFPKERVHVVPNGVSGSFFDATPAAWHAQFGPGEFILCVGAVQARKGQLLLVEVANRLNLPVVLLGPALPGEERYVRLVAAAMQQNERLGGRWLTTLRNEDPLLPSAYAACRVFGLLSNMETQPLSIMQAMAAQKPVLVLDAPYRQDPLFRDLPAVESAAPDVVATALRNAWDHPLPTKLSADYTWLGAARRLSQVYRDVLAISPGQT